MTWNFRRIVGLIAVVAGLLIVAGLFFVDVPANNREPLLTMAGVVIGWGTAVINYEFGSSSGGRALALREAAPEERE